MGSDRDRSRKRSRSRERRRSRSRSRERRGWSDPDPNSAMVQMQALAAVQAQAQIQRQMLAQQQMLGPVAPLVTPPTAALLAAAAAAGGATAAVGGATAAVGGALPAGDTQARKSREIYIGNLAIGTVSIEMLTELFNAALAGMVPDPVTSPPVLTVKMDSTGRFAFVEFRTEELATTAMTLDKTELCGRQMNIGRPKGYVPGSGSAAASTNETLAAAQQVAAALMGATNVVLLEKLLDAATIRSPDERQEVSEMVYEEAVRCGKVLGIAVPMPPPEVADDESCRVYVKFSSSGEATKCKEMMDGRLFDDNKVKARHVTEIDYNRAAAGEWILPVQLPPVVPASLPPGLGAPGGFLAGMPGLSGIPALQGSGSFPGLMPDLGAGGALPHNFMAFPPPPP